MIQPPLDSQINSVRSMLPYVRRARLHALASADEFIRHNLVLPEHTVWRPDSWIWGRTPTEAEWWPQWKPVIEAEPELLYVMACAPAGRVRVRACKELGKRPSQLALALLLVRSNDWVQPVRGVARSLLKEFLVPAYAAWWVEALPLVLRFQQEVRAPFPELGEEVRTLLEAPDSSAAVAQGWRSPSAQVRLSMLQLLGSDELAEDIQLALATDHNLRIRRRLVSIASPAALRRLATDPVTSVRREAFARLLPTVQPATERPEMRAALLDTRSSVRSLAQYALKKAGEDIHAFYLGLGFSSLGAREKVGVLGGLTDLGERADAQWVWPFLNSAESALVQAEALRTLAVLSPTEAAPLLWEGLKHTGPKARQAERSLVQAHLVSEEPLQALWRTGELRNRRTALRLVKTLPRFETVTLLLEWRSDEPALTHVIDLMLLLLLFGHGTRFFTRPAPERLERLLRARTTDLPPAVQRELDALGTA